MNQYKSLLAMAAIALSIVSCKKDSNETNTTVVPTPENNLITLGETYLTGAATRAVVYTDKVLETGYNAIYVALYDSTDGTAVSEGHLEITPMMDMGMMEHSSPVENSESEFPENGYFKSYVVFSMPGTSMEWSLDMHFHNHDNGLSGEGSLGVDVVSSDPARFISTVLAADGDAKVFISMIQPMNPEVGLNPFEIVLHKKVSMMDYPAVEDYTVEIEPWMPGMGHGSPNNVNPVHTEKGHYAGTVNFTMTGLWHVKLRLYKNGVLLSDDQYFEITL